MSAGDEPPSVPGTPSASSVSSRASTPESRHVVCPDLTRGPLGMVSEVLRVQDRLAASALVQFVSLFCCYFQMFMNKCVAWCALLRV